MKAKVLDMEYYFCDTDKELPETYEYLSKLEAFLGKPIARLNAKRGFDYWLKVYGGYLPSPNMRWCTRMLKIRPFEEWIGDDPTISYVGIRADEESRKGYHPPRDTIKAVYPFIENGIVREDVFRILEESGVGVPSYYKWRSRSGCYFCFFQRKMEWVGLKERHPELFEKAKEYETKSLDPSLPGFSWSGEYLEELEQSERVEGIKLKHHNRQEEEQKSERNMRLIEAFERALDRDDDGDSACLECSL